MFAASAIADLENVVTSELRELNCWFVANSLSLNVAKIEFIYLGQISEYMLSRITK